MNFFIFPEKKEVAVFICLELQLPQVNQYGSIVTNYDNYFITNRIYNKILDHDWFSARLFVT